MERLYNAILTAIKQQLNDTESLIDEDTGQLEALVNGDDRYPLTYPAVLIGTPEVNWENLNGRDDQRGTLRLRIRLAIDCYDDTHYGSGTEEKVAERLLLNKNLTAAIHGQRFDGAARKMVRSSSRSYSLPGGIKVYETDYTTTVADE